MRIRPLPTCGKLAGGAVGCGAKTGGSSQRTAFFRPKTFLHLLNSSIHMPKTQSYFAFRWLLPIVQIIVCLTVLWPWRATLLHQIGSSVHAYRALESSLPQATHGDTAGALVSVYVYADPEESRKTQALERNEWVPLMLNLPSGLVQLPYVILNPSREDWSPSGINLRTWRVISWPIIGILFWWSAGRGIEALIAGRRRNIGPRITWLETVIAAQAREPNSGLVVMPDGSPHRPRFADGSPPHTHGLSLALLS